MADIIQVRRGTAALWTSTNTLLAEGEYGFETDTGKLKIGDGTTVWTGLPYFVGSPGLPAATAIGQVLISVDGSTFTVHQPVTTDDAGWLIHDDGTLVVS